VLHDAARELRLAELREEEAALAAAVGGRLPREPRFSVRRVALSLAEGSALNDYGLTEHEQKILRAAALAAGEPHAGGYHWIPWSGLTKPLGREAVVRAMSVVPGSKGGYMVGVQQGPMADALRGDSAIIAAGATVREGLTDNVVGSRVGSVGTNVVWLAEGAAPGSDDDSVLGQVSLTPREVMAKTDVSLQLLRSPNAEGDIRTLLTGDVGEAIDVAFVSGAGGAQPVGIMNTTGVVAVSGTALSWATVADMRKTALNAGADEEDLFFLAAPDTQKILSTREKSTGSGFIWANGMIDGIPATATKHVTNGALICGVASQILIGSWGPGLKFAISPSSGFNQARVALRITMRLDVTVLQPSSFSIATSVT
jgi:HK97 family phage major capsid protein